MTPLLEARALSKRFPGVQALAEVNAVFRSGEVTAVMGENGAGKSTLMKALAGVHLPDAGEVRWEGKPVRISSVAQAEAMGIAFIHQELNLCENLTVAGNVYLGREPRRGGIFLDQRRMNAGAAALLERVGLTVPPDTRVDSLSIGRRQLVEIARALSREAKLVIMDEPTSSLSAREAERLFDVVRELKSRGMAVVFISHRLPEVQAVADRVIVLKDGRNSGNLTKDEIAPERIVNLMVGRDLDLSARRPAMTESGAVRLEVSGLRTATWPAHTVDFSVRAGEICGLAGLVGAGRTEIVRALFGIDRPLAGFVRVDGRVLPPGRPREAIAAGMALAPEDRKDQGLFPPLSVRENIALAGLERLRRRGFVSESAVTDQAETLREELSIRCRDVSQDAAQLSGGNQQKVVLAKWLARGPGVFLLDEPTRGVDVGARGEIYRVIERLAADGAAVLVVSSDLEELLRISDRILVLHEGRLTGTLTGPGRTEEAVMRLATGGES